ncbi:pantoate--beta-alanine ligase [Bradyrhizobium barranii]|uniref:pantoate--beta-alanine ligase n=1 Tax=Bradyrhizobium TaxID=374 RepID=UPI003F23C4BB
MRISVDSLVTSQTVRSRAAKRSVSSLRRIPGDLSGFIATSSNRRTRQASARLHFRGVAKYVCKLIRIVQPIVACIGEKGSTTRGRAPHGRESKSFDRDPHRFETVRSRQARDEQSDRHLIEQERLVGCRGPFTSGSCGSRRRFERLGRLGFSTALKEPSRRVWLDWVRSPDLGRKLAAS